MERPFVGKSLLAAAAIVWAWLCVCSASANEQAERLFVQQVKPLLAAKCAACHGDAPDDVKGELSLLSREALLRGGESGEPSIVPGKPDESLLILAVRWDGLEMPPKENDRLTAAQIESLRTWIAAGAPWPDADRERLLSEQWAGKLDAGGVYVKTSGGLSDAWTNRRYQPEDLWAYQPVVRHDVPWAALNGDERRNPIDAFVMRALGEREIDPAPHADRRELIRRLSFGLTGLPPTHEQTESFATDERPDAYRRLVDRLLDSLHYGERMAQHWLDVVRYADTSGYANDYERPHAWRYRDYVIRSFNDDKPFDQFVVEQIAGDELLAHSSHEVGQLEQESSKPASAGRSSSNSDLLIATGYLRMGPWEHTAMSVAAETRQLWLDDVTNSVGEAFLGHALRCAKCHDHKFEPIPTRDYYAIQAVFAGTQFDDAAAPFSEHEQIGGRQRHDEIVARQLSALGIVPITDLKGDNAFSRLQKKLTDYRERALQRYEPVAFSVKNAKPEEISILIGGSLEQPGPRVQPDVLSAVEFGWTGDGHAMPRSSDGRRLALARWIADARNPLTARVIVNRVWQWHFGRGLVATPNNFGKTGAKPTHPELLDWLAAWFVDHDWSIKELTRLIVTSDAYQRSTRHPQAELLAERDPTNELLARFAPRRLTAEELRDAMLFTTGELSIRSGGPGTFPEINWEVALQPRHIMGGIATSYRPSLVREDRHRRAIYDFRYRGLSNPMLEVFNQPNADLSCERRDETTVAPQAFELFNSQFAHDRALALAARITDETADVPSQIRAAFQFAYGREPTGDEESAAAMHVMRMLAWHREHEPEPRPIPSIVEREMIAEETGVPFRWTEHLSLDGYESDLKPWEASPETRALAEVCLVLLNASEFLYVY